MNRGFVEEIEGIILRSERDNEDKYERYMSVLAGKRALALFGAGREGVKVAERLAKAFPDKVLFFVDNDAGKQGREIVPGIYCRSPKDMREYAADELAVLNTTLFYVAEIQAYIADLGLSGCLVPPLQEDPCRRGFASFLYRVGNARLYASHLPGLWEAANLLADADSLRVFAGAIRCRVSDENLTGDLLSLPQYFPKEIRELLGRDEVFYDCGAYIGDTTEAFVEQTKENFRAVYAFEMDPSIFKQLESNKKLKDDKISLFPFGVSNCNRVVEFTPMGEGEGSSYAIRFSGKLIAKAEAQLRSLDALREDGVLAEPATFVKMDIEGAEMDALQGMQRMITRYKPKLAVCVYHKPEDLWEIPLYIHKLVPGHRLILRQHSPLMDNDTVLYAF